jgi:hypothetical protein
MRRSICYCEPSYAQAGESKTWKFIYTTASTIPKGSRIKFDMMSKGRDIDWEIPEVNVKKGGNVIYAKLDNGKILQAKEIEVVDRFTPDYEFVLTSEIEAGGTFSVIIGSTEPEKRDPERGTAAQHNTQRRRNFYLYIDPTGKGNYQDPEVFTLDVRGAILKNIRVLAPSFVTRNKRFDVIVRFEDAYGNLTNTAPDDTLIELSYEHLRENLNWKLFVPETGFIALPNLYFNEPGVYTIQLLNTKSKEIFRSSPIRCFPENTKSLFWGILHGESERIDSTESIESCLRHFRDDKAANFFGVSPFESQEETSNETWKLVAQNILDFDENDRFTTFLGMQYAGDPGEEGVRTLVYLKDHKQILRRKDPKYASLKKLYKNFTPKEILSIPCFTMGKGTEFNFSEYDPEFERVVEIYNAWGSSECSKKEGNTFPVQTTSKKGFQEALEGSVQRALNKNCRFGFVAGGLDDRGVYSDLYEGDQVQYTPGMTAIIATEHSRGALGEALYNRSCYATTGVRMILGLYLAGNSMGTETSTADKHGLLINRHLSGYAAGTTKLKKVEIIRNGKVIKTFEPDGYSFDFTYDDMIALEKVVIDAKDKKPPFVYYYLRVTQEDGNMGWTSPIWVDYIPNSPIKRSIIPRAAKPTKKSLIIEDIEDEEEDEDLDEDSEHDL